MKDDVAALQGSPNALQLALACRQLEAHRELLSSEPVAIIGMGCRFPGAVDPDAYWRLIAAGTDAVGPIPAGRAAPRDASGAPLFPPFGGYLDDIAGFDPEFFGISPREAKALDPQQRLLLEVAWETLEDAQQAPERLHRDEVGVFIGMSSADYAAVHQQNRSFATLDAYFGTGNAPSVAAGRLSYVFGWLGPAMTVDTSCSSSLVAVHLAARALRQRECRLALAGGVNILLAPETSIAFARAGMLSAGGRCRTFRADADGYVRGEGCGLVLLARLDHAIAAGLPVRAIMRGSAVNQDGPSGGLTVPNGPAQVRAIAAALKSARLRPEDVQYVEAHGTATPLGDPIELNALEEAYGGPGRRVWAGSAKTLFGHLESAAGVAGLIKAVLALEHRRIPADARGGPLTAAVPWSTMSVQLPQAIMDWPTPTHGSARAAGISSFGFSGTNAHVVIEEAPATTASIGPAPAAILPVSARSEAALGELVSRYRHTAESLTPDRLDDVLRVAQAGRNHFPHRAVFDASSIEALRASLAARQPGIAPQKLKRLAFLFTGQASQYLGMGAGLYRSNPVFRAALDACDAITARLGMRLLPDLLGEAKGAASNALRRAAFAQPALTAVQISLIEMWAAWGVQADAVLGHSLGEIAAAFAAGVLGREDALRLALARGRAMDQLGRPGGMIAVSADESQMVDVLADTGLQAEIAVINAPRQLVVAAPLEELPALEARLRTKAIPARRLDVTHAFHSLCVAPILPDLAQELAALQFRAPQIPFVSGMSARVEESCADPAYWLAQVRRPVRFADAFACLAQMGFAAALELGPSPLLSRLARQQPAGQLLPCIETLADGQSDWSRISKALGALYLHGTDIDWKALNAGAGAARVDLPHYPFQRRRLWLDPIDGEPVRSADPVNPAISYDIAWRLLERPSADALPAPSVIAPAVLKAAIEASDRGDLERYAHFSAALAASIPSRLLNVFRQMGWTPDATGATADELAESMSVQPSRRPLFDWILDTLASAGLLQRTGQHYLGVSIAGADHSEAPRGDWAEMELVERSVAALPGILTGRLDPLDVLARDGDLSLLRRLYGEGPLTALMNGVTARIVAEACRTAGRDRIWRVLEVGAGTASTSRRLINALEGIDRLHYTLTDISPAFVAGARSQFTGDPRIDFRTFDVESDPMAQGFRPGEVDLIIAANVLHATASIAASIAHLRSLLAPGGWLVLLEGVQPVAWVDLIFGLTDGWWRFRGDPTRPTHPLLAAEAWTELLDRSGFEDATVLRPSDAGASLMSQQAVIVARRKAVAETGAWLVVGDPGGAAGRLIRDLEARGTPCRQVPPDALENAFDMTDMSTVRAVVLLHGLELTACTSPVEALWDACATVREAARIVSSRHGNCPIISVTRDGLLTGPAEAPDPLQAALAAFVRSLQAEAPLLNLRGVDLDGVDAQLAGRLDRVLAEASEQQTAWRELSLRAPRLVRASASSGDNVLKLRRDGNYLVTGASGDLARVLAPWLARSGAGHLTLATRDPPTLPDQIIRASKDEGAGVDVVKLDLSDTADLQRVLSGLAARPLDARPLRGIFHLAGVLDTAAAAELDWQRFHDVWNAKVEGARHLDRLTHNLNLDHFVLFSSSAAVMPIVGQAAYASANAALDALAADRRRQGLPGLSVNWGPWRRENFASSDLERAYAQYRALGISPLDQDGALAVLARLMAAKASGAVIIDVDWDRLFRVLPSARGLALLREIPVTTTRRSALRLATNGDLGRELRTLGLGARKTRLETVFRDTLATILETSAEAIRMEDPLAVLGMDSLMAVEFRTEVESGLGIEVPLSALLGGATLGEIVARLAAALDIDPQPQSVNATSALSARRPLVVEGEL